ncbi:MAG: hypothetical protein AB8B64_27220 [Granulosicoccus sp.]
MKWKKWLENWDMTSLKISVPYLEMEFEPREADRAAAWSMYVELLTRVSTQPLPDCDGDEATALDSIYSLFPLTRQIMREQGVDCMEFSKLAIVILNQRVRPFTAKWHRLKLQGAFSHPDQCRQFRDELRDLQQVLMVYTGMLGEIAGVEDDLRNLEQDSTDA